MAVHETDIIYRILVGDVRVAGQALVPRIAPMDWPLGHQPGAGGMFDGGQTRIEERRLGWVIARVVATIIDIAAIVENVIWLRQMKQWVDSGSGSRPKV